MLRWQFCTFVEEISGRVDLLSIYHLSGFCDGELKFEGFHTQQKHSCDSIHSSAQCGKSPLGQTDKGGGGGGKRRELMSVNTASLTVTRRAR